MENKNRTLSLFATACMFFIYAISASAQNFIGNGSSLELSNLSGRIGLSLEPKTPIEGNVLTLKGGDRFTLSAGTIMNGSSSDKVAVALVGSNRALREILAEQNLGVNGNTTLFFECKIGDNTQVNEGDVIMLVTPYANGMYQQITTSYGGVVTQIPATNYELPFHKINLPDNVPGVTITKGETVLYRDKIVRGRNYAFYVKPDNSKLKVIVEANGQPLAEQYGYYALNYVLTDYDISVRVFDPDTAVTYRNIELSESVRLGDLLSQEQMDCISHLKVTGWMSDEDIYTIRDRMPFLSILDLSEANVKNNYMPEGALQGRASITKLYLPETLEGLSTNAFYAMTGLTSIILPEKLNVFGYNQFFGCSSLKTVWVKWNPGEHGSTMGFPIPPCAFRSTPYDYDGTLIVPKGCLNAYSQSSVWGEFKTIREEYPIDELVYGVGSVAVTGVDENRIADAVEVAVENGMVCVRNNSDRPLALAVYGMDGRRYHNSILDVTETALQLEPGVYVLVAGDERMKIIVR